MSSTTRELVFCHHCKDEWYRDEHGLECPAPSCRSDCVEIIESHDDPRAPQTRGMELPGDFGIDGDDDDDDNDSEDARAPATFLRVEGPDFAFTSTTTRMLGRGRGGDGGAEEGSRGRPREATEAPDDMATELFTTMLRNILGDIRAPRPAGESGAARGGMGSAPDSPGGGNPHAHAYFGPSERFRYDSGARLNPRDADSPQPPAGAQVVDLATFVTSLFGNGPSGAEMRDLGPVPVTGILAQLMGMAPGPGSGDYVHSQRELDRVISQLMEDHQGNAPPPAPKEVIQSLGKMKVTQQMVDDKVDCAVCKEDLVVDEEVTKLPCNHTYHFDCVAKWLEAHDTCPICRKSVTPEDRQQQQHDDQSQSRNWSFGSATSRPPWMPQPSQGDRGGGGGGSSGDGGGNNSNSGTRGSLASFFRRGV